MSLKTIKLWGALLVAAAMAVCGGEAADYTGGNIGVKGWKLPVTDGQIAQPFRVTFKFRATGTNPASKGHHWGLDFTDRDGNAGKLYTGGTGVCFDLKSPGGNWLTKGQVTAKNTSVPVGVDAPWATFELKATDVGFSVRYNGEELNSADDSLTTRTEFGTLSFENGEDENDRVKVLRLKEGADYDVSIVGTGRGFMEYTIGFSDENGNYTDFRTFENIRIRKGTQIETTAAQNTETELRVDEDGDGSYEKCYRAGANAVGEEVKTEPMVYVVCGLGGLLVLLVLIGTFWILHKKRKVNKNHG